MKNIKLYGILIAVLSLFVSGCGNKETAQVTSKTETASNAPSAAATSKSIDLSTAGSLKGRILFEGTAPEPKAISVKGNPECSVLHPGGNVMSEELLVKNGGLQNAFVYVKEGLEAYTFEIPTQPVVITNNTCVYSPHVVGAQVNQPIIFQNNDATLHNIHSYPKANKAFNLGLPIQGMKQTKKFSAAEVMVPMKCDVHPWMQGYIGVLAHPYFSVSDAEGNFEIKSLPPGEYLIEVWHEKLGVQSQKIKIEPQQTQTLDIKFSA